MIHRKWDEICATDIRALRDSKVPESRTIEYKESIAVGTDGEKKEFLADVSSFSNASGGDLLFGIKAEDGIPIEIPGLKIINEDKEKLRLENLIRDGVEPRIPGIQMKVIGGFADGPVLVVRSPQSWSSRRMVMLAWRSRLYASNNAGKGQMDLTGIQTAFTV